MAWFDFIPMDKDKIKNITEFGGVYQLNSDKETIYFGKSNNLQRRLMEHIDSDDSCIKKAIEFRYQVTNTYDELEEELLKKYKAKYGKLPICNDKIS